MNLSTVKWAQWDKTQSRELLGLFICVCIALCTIVAQNTAQNRPDNFPSYSSDNHHCSNDVYWGKRKLSNHNDSSENNNDTYRNDYNILRNDQAKFG